MRDSTHKTKKGPATRASATEPLEGGGPAPIEKLRWLMRLRWLALLGVSAGSTAAAWGLVPGIHLTVILLGVMIGVASNGYIQWRIRRWQESGDSAAALEGLHVGQAVLDTLVLSIVLWGAGGSDCPFITFYTFPVLLASLLSGRVAFWPTTLASLSGLAWQALSARVPSFSVGRWDPSPGWGEALSLVATIITMAMAAYFAARFTDALRAQARARRAADELLQLTLDRLEAGVELIEGGRTTWQNTHAALALGDRLGAPWACPGLSRKGQCAHRARGCALAAEEAGARGEEGGPSRCQFSLQGSGARGGKIYEVMLLSPPAQPQRVALYVERTAEVVYQQRLMHTERLASLGRAAQGVAHELNTPLATIQTLSRDLFEALRGAPLAPPLRADVEESAGLIIDEVQRCRRITHALLGRAERGGAAGGEGGERAALADVVGRAVALVFPYTRERVRVDLNDHGARALPRDAVTQICVNLLQNASDAHPGGEVKVSARLEGDRLLLCVRDHGGGISEEASRLIFEPFFTTKSAGQGTGLGLYTSYGLAKELGGELSLVNHAEGGALATLSLPLSPLLSPPLSPPAPGRG